MPLAPVIDKLEDVAEPLRSLYVQRDGKFHVDLSGTPAGFVSAADYNLANSKVVEFRDNNTKLLQRVGELEPTVKKFEGIDADAARAALKNAEDLKKKGVGNAEDVAKLVADALKPVQDQLATIAQQSEARRVANEALTLRTSIGDEFIKAGGEPDAIDFILGKAKDVFDVDGTSVKAKANRFSADKPGEALSVKEWLTGQTRESAFAFKRSSGSGANPTTPGGGGSRPGVIDLKDPTPQQLGEHAAAIAKGTMRIVNTNTQPV